MKPSKEYKGPIHIYFASQSGTAFKFAEELSELLFERNLVNFIHDIKKFNINQFRLQENVIMLLSTHYDGDPPDDCTSFLPELKNSLNRENISKKKFCIFGLGDVTYDRFNEFAKQVNRVFTKYKSQEVMSMGLGSDHEGNIEQYFDKWKRKCVRAWARQPLGLFKGNLQLLLKTKAGRPLGIDFADDPKFARSKRFIEELDFASNNLLKNSKISTVLDVKELRKKPREFEKTLLVTFLLEEPGEFVTGQNIAIFPKNSPKDVARAAELFNLNVDKYVLLKVEENVVKVKTNVPHGTRVKCVLEEILDLKGILKKKQIENILKLEYVDNQTKNILKNLLENPEDLKMLTEARFGFLDVLEHFKIKIKFIDFIRICEVIKPRIFTICKSSNVSPQKAELVISTVHDKLSSEATKWSNSVSHPKDTWTGLTSQYFINLFHKSQTKKGLNKESMRYIIQDSSFKVKDFLFMTYILLNMLIKKVPK
jgi:sulfite reductase alpha subunit-like flavoprotein